MSGSAVLSVEVVDDQGQVNPAEPQVVFEGPFRSDFDFDVSADEERFLLIRYPPERRQKIHIIQGWLGGVTERLPIN